MSDALANLQQWYLSQCDGDWEHSEGVRIDTLDNPGWAFKVDLQGTTLEERPFPNLDRGAGTSDWLHCHRTESAFEGYGGPLMLGEMIAVFLDWAQEAAE